MSAIATPPQTEVKPHVPRRPTASTPRPPAPLSLSAWIADAPSAEAAWGVYRRSLFAGEIRDRAEFENALDVLAKGRADVAADVNVRATAATLQNQIKECVAATERLQSEWQTCNKADPAKTTAAEWPKIKQRQEQVARLIEQKDLEAGRLQSNLAALRAQHTDIF